MARFKPKLAVRALVTGALILGEIWVWNHFVRPWSLVRSGVAMLAEARLDEAIEALREAIRLRPDSVAAHANLGTALDRQGNVELGIAALRKAIRLDPGYAPAHSALGDVLSRIGKLDDAADEYRTATRLQPGDGLTGRASYMMGKTLRRQGKLEEAIAAYKDAIAAGAPSEMVFYDLYDAENAQKKASKAMAEYRDAIRAKPTEVAVHKNFFGTALLYQGKLSEAAVELREAIRLRPDFADAHYHLACTLIREEELVEAVVEPPGGDSP